MPGSYPGEDGRINRRAMFKRFIRSPRTITFQAVYRDGALRPAQALHLPEETSLSVTVELPVEAEAGVGWGTTAVKSSHTGWALLFLALLIYTITRFVGLADFPIYFFSDEAIQTILAEELVQNRFRDVDGVLFPPYFKNYQVWNLSLSVYMQVLPLLLFGKSLFVTRAVSAVVSMMGAAAVALILKWAFQARFWWLGALVLAGAPAWYLHSRTAFETVLMVSFYALFLLCYLLYHGRSPAFLFPALIFAAAAFYAYSNGQAVIGIVALLLFTADFGYHRRQAQALIQRRRWGALALVALLIVALALPYLRFRLNYPTDLAYHLRSLDSYLLKDLSPAAKAVTFVQKYLYGLSPGYWFFPNEHDLMRHRIPGYFGHMWPELLPFFLIGLLLCVRRWRAWPYRTLLIALLVTPIGAATVDIAITRVLSFVVPAAVLIVLGVEWVIAWLPSRAQPVAGLLCFALLAGASLWLWRDSLVNGPLYHRNYGLFGMQYGASQLFTEIEAELAREPAAEIMLTPTWANGTDLFPRFFLPSSQTDSVQTVNVDAFLLEKRPLSAYTIFIMTPAEYQRAIASGKFKNILVERLFLYPDDSPGFYFVRLAYVDDIDAIFAAEKEARRQPVTSQVEWRGQPVTVLHSLLDGGRLADMFDGDVFTLARVMEANPALFDFTWPQPHPFTGLGLTVGTMDFQLTVSLYETAESDPTVYQQTFRGLGPDPHVDILFDRGPAQAARLRVDIEALSGGANVKIHVREMVFQTAGQ
jgi:hypothetical protein